MPGLAPGVSLWGHDVSRLFTAGELPVDNEFAGFRGLRKHWQFVLSITKAEIVRAFGDKSISRLVLLMMIILLKFVLLMINRAFCASRLRIGTR